MVVIPPAAAAFVAVSYPSQLRPRAEICVWTSIRPGERTALSVELSYLAQGERSSDNSIRSTSYCRQRLIVNRRDQSNLHYDGIIFKV